MVREKEENKNKQREKNLANERRKEKKRGKKKKKEKKNTYKKRGKKGGNLKKGKRKVTLPPRKRGEFTKDLGGSVQWSLLRMAKGERKEKGNPVKRRFATG